MMPLLNRVYHIVRGRERLDTINNLMEEQLRTRAIKPSAIVLIHDPAARAKQYSYMQDPLMGCNAGPYGSIPVHVLKGNFNPHQGEEIYVNAFADFGKFLWAKLRTAGLSPAGDAMGALFREMAEGGNVLHCHSLALSLVMALKPHAVSSPGVILSPHYQSPTRSRLILDFIQEHKRNLHPTLFDRLSDTLEDRQAPGTAKYGFDDKGILYYGLPQERGQLDFLFAAYLEATHGSEYNFTANLTTMASEKPVFDRVYVLTPEREGGGPQIKGSLIAEELQTDPLLSRAIDPDGIHVIGLANTETAGADIVPWSKIKGNLAGYVTLMERAIAEAGNDKRAIACVNEGGTSTRSPLEASKGSIVSGENRLRSVGLSSALHAAKQLPNEGRGWMILMSCDNRNFGKGPMMVGEALLQHTPFKFMLFQKAHKTTNLGRFVNRGVSIVDHKTGAILVFAEKLKIAMLQALVDQHEVNTIYENTMWQAVHISVAKKIVKLYNENCQASGLPLIQHYPLDFSMDLVTPLQKQQSDLDRAQFAGSLEKRCKDAGIAFDRRDADRLFDIAQEIARLTGGVGSVKVGAFFDEGDMPTLRDTSSTMIASSAPIPRKKSQKKAREGRALTNLVRLTSGMAIGDKWLTNRCDIYVVPPGGAPRPDKINILDKNTTYIGKRAKLPPGTIVSPHTLIVGNTNITEEALPADKTLPPNLIITGSQLEGAVQFTPAFDPQHTDPWRILYHVVVRAGEEIQIPNDGAAVGYVIPEEGVDDSRHIGMWPINVDMKQVQVNPNCTVARSQIPAEEFDKVKHLFADPSQEELTFKPGLKTSAFDNLGVSDATRQIVQPNNVYLKDPVFGEYDLDGEIHSGQFIASPTTIGKTWLQVLTILRESPTTSA